MSARTAPPIAGLWCFALLLFIGLASLAALNALDRAAAPHFACPTAGC